VPQCDQLDMEPIPDIGDIAGVGPQPVLGAQLSDRVYLCVPAQDAGYCYSHPSNASYVQGMRHGANWVWTVQGYWAGHAGPCSPQDHAKLAIFGPGSYDCVGKVAIGRSSPTSPWKPVFTDATCYFPNGGAADAFECCGGDGHTHKIYPQIVFGVRVIFWDLQE
jgi:hypothetical protein